jgi:hypothetical protein
VRHAGERAVFGLGESPRLYRKVHDSDVPDQFLPESPPYHKAGILSAQESRRDSRRCVQVGPRRLRPWCRAVLKQELRTVRVHDRLLDKVSDGLIREVTLEFILGSDQTA